MSSLAHPRGPEPPRTYWIRRAITLLALLVALLVLGSTARTLLGHGRASAGPVTTPNPSDLAQNLPTPKASASASASASARASASASASASSAPDVACASGAVRVQVVAASRVAVGGSEPLRVSLTNLARTACHVDFARTPLAIRVTSGVDRIWSTADCSDWTPSGVTDPLRTGSSYSWTVNWPTKRSSSKCTLGTSSLQAGTYVVTAALGTGAVGQRTIRVVA